MRAAILAGVWAFVLTGCGPTATTSEKKEEAKKEKRTKEELAKALVGKTEDEVIKLVGRPDQTSEYGDGKTHWRYRGKELTYDPVSQKYHNVTIVTFGKDKLASGVDVN